MFLRDRTESIRTRNVLGPTCREKALIANLAKGAALISFVQSCRERLHDESVPKRCPCLQQCMSWRETAPYGWRETASFGERQTRDEQTHKVPRTFRVLMDSVKRSDRIHQDSECSWNLVHLFVACLSGLFVT